MKNLTYLKLRDAVPLRWEDFKEDLFINEFPVLVNAKTTPQDPVYHGEGDVWTHTKMVIKELVSSPTYLELSDEDRFILFYAGLLHDVSKYKTTIIDEATGKISQPGHSKKGAIEARVILWKKEVPFSIREQICNLIASHQLPFFIMKSDIYLKSIYKLSWELNIKLLCDLAEADIRGRICPDVSDVLTNIELLREVAKEENCYTSPRSCYSTVARLEYARHGKGHPDFDMFKPDGSLVIVMCGMPASGKNTWVAKNSKGLPVISFDDEIEAQGLKHGGNVGKAIHSAIDKAKELLRSKAPFVWNSTHLSQQMRDKTLDLLYSYNATVTIVYLEESYKETLARNSKRNSTLSNSALEAMLHKWEPPFVYECESLRTYAN